MKLMTINAPPELLRELAEQDFELVALDYSGWIDDYPPINPRCQILPFETKIKIDLPAIWQLRGLLAEHRPDLVHAFLPKPLSNAILASTGMKQRPRIVSFRGVSSVPNRWDPTSYLTYLSPKVDFHACESQAVQQALVRGGISENLCDVVYNCVRAQPVEKPRRELLTEFNIPRDAFVIGTVASIRPVKGIDLLLEAAIAGNDLTDTYFLLVGPLRDQRVARLLGDPRLRDRVRHVGFRKDASILAGAMDLFVMPSRQEALCRALLEAMSQAVCPVVSSAGGMPEIVRDGIDGRVFPVGNVAALTAILRELHANRQLIEQFGHSARERVREMCSPQKMCARTVNIYRRLTA